MSAAPPALLMSYQDRMKSLLCAEEMSSSDLDVLFLVYIVLELLQSTTVYLAVTQSAALAHSPAHYILASWLTPKFTSYL